MHKIVVLVLCCFFELLLPVAEAQDDLLISNAEKEKTIQKMVQKLQKDGYAFNITFDDIAERLDRHQEEIDTSSTIGSFARSMNKVFNSYGLSHFWIWTPEDMMKRKQNTDVGIGASYTKTVDGYFISRVTKNGVADRAGIQPVIS